MKSRDLIPYYAPDGTSLGFRTLDAAERLVAGGYVKASYGRKKNLRAIWHCQDDGPTQSRHTRKQAPVTASSSDWSTAAVGVIGVLIGAKSTVYR